MGVFAILFVGLLVVGGGFIKKPNDTQIEEKKEIIITAKTVEIEPTIRELKVEPKEPEVVKEEIVVEPKEPEAVKEEIVVEPKEPEVVKEEIVVEPKQLELANEEIKELDSSENSVSKFSRLILYIIGGILAIIIGSYIFLRKRKVVPSNIPYDYTKKDIKEEQQPDTSEQQPDTSEQQPDEEDKNNKK